MSSFNISRFMLGYIVVFLLVTSRDIVSQEQTDVKRPKIYAPYISNPLTIDGNPSDWITVKALGEGVTFYKGDGNEGTSTKNLGTTIRKQVDDKKKGPEAKYAPLSPLPLS